MQSTTTDLIPGATTSCTRRDGAERYSLPRIITFSLLTFGCMLPVTMLVPALKELIGDRYGATPFWTHSFMSINMIGAILAGPIMVLLTDGRFQRRHVAAAALAMDAVLLASMAVAPSLPAMLGFRFLEGAAHILALSTLMATASTWSDPARRGRTMGFVGAMMMFGTACGTRLGGIVWDHWPDWTFQIAGMISGAVAILSLLFVAEPTRQVGPRQRGGFVAVIRDRPALVIAFAYAFVDRFSVGVVITTFGLFLANIHGLTPPERSLTLLWFLLPFSILIFPAGLLVDRFGRIWPISLGSMGFGVLFALYGFVPAERLDIIMIASGILSAIMFAPNLTLCADLAPIDQRGAAFTGFNIAGSLGFIVGPLFAGAVFTWFARLTPPLSAYQSTFILTGATQVLCGLVTLPMLIRLKVRGLTF